VRACEEDAAEEDAMKIALCVSSLPLSGIGTSIGIIRSGLSNTGHIVDVLVTSDRPGADLERARRNGWSIRCCCEGVRFLRERLRLTLKCLSDYDVIINNHSMETQLIAACLPGNIIRISVMRALSDSALEQVSLNSQYFDAAVAISQEMWTVMEDTSEIRCPVHLIPNCTEGKANGHIELDSPIKIAYVGWLRKRDKNVLLLPDIVTCLNKYNIDFSLTIAGDGPDRRVLEEKMEQVKGKSRVMILGEVSRDRALDILKKSHFTLIPSFYEGLSNVMLESMALGSVPIASNIPNFQWVLGDVATKLQVPISSPDAYAKRIVELSADTSEYNTIQGYLRQRQQTMFTPEKTVSGYLDLISKLKTDRNIEDLVSVPFDSVTLPRKYRRQCQVWWRCLQIARDCLQIRTL
jgi:glycosyltransferase involved in cell wall biosynthesis